MKQHQTNSFISRAAMMLLTVIMAFAGAQTAWAEGVPYIFGEVMVNINGSGTVTLTHSGGTDVVVKSGTIYRVSGDYTLKFLPSGANVINKVTYLPSAEVNAEDITTNLTPIDGGKSYSDNIHAGIDEYNVYFGEPDAASRYALAWNGSTMTFSVGGETVTAAEEGQRVDITLSDPDDHCYWAVSSNDVSPITQDDANHFHFTMPANDVRVTAYLTHIPSYTFTDNSTHGHVNCSGGNEWGKFYAGETATLTVEADAYYMYTDGTLSAKKQNGEAIDLTDQGDGTWTLIMPESNVYVTATFIPDPDHFEDNSDGTYTIKSAAGWGVFCDALQDLDTYNRFIGKTVKLAGDITVSSMAGSDSHDFCGTFDGQEHTLTFNYNTGTDDAAPFRYVEDGCVIENLRVCGTIQTSAKYAAGLIAHQYGNVTIRNCRSSVTIKSSTSSSNGDGTHGGFVAQNHNAGDITFEGCLFDGKLLKTGSTATTRCGGFVGWRSNNEGAVIKVKNSLYAPAALEVGEYWISTTESATFVRNGIASDITNSYYTSDFNNSSSFTGQGKQLRSIAAGEGVTLGHAGAATEYSVSGITAYKASGASGDSDPFIAGLLYNNNVVDVLYAGSGDVVSLTLSNTGAPLGYRYTYAFSGGTADEYEYSADYGETSYHLTMPDQDVTVNVDTETLRSTGQAVSVSYVDAGGQPASHDAIALDGTETTLGQNNQETWYYVGTDITVNSRINLTGDANLILGDDCTLDVKGIYITQGNTLTIYAQSDGENAGRIVSHPTSGAAIGGMTGSDNGNIVIYGGNIEAAGADNCAGIGSADGRTGGTITIYGGTVTAKGGTDGAAIGGGRSCSGGTITIYGGTITANGPTDTDTCENGAGIGGGEGGDGGTITINGGTITTYSRDGAGIGGGDDGDGGTITINGGTITSNKVDRGQGARIGGGGDAAPGTITINGGTITTEGGSGAGIGGGKRNLANGTVTINGGVINASGTYGIGAGQEGANVAIILGWTSADDRITASTYGGTVTIADGKAFHNGSEVLAPGEVTDMDKLNGKTLIGVDVLQDNAANDVAALATRLGGKQTNIALSGRKLWKDGAWNTLVLPFTIDDIQADGCPLNGATVRQLSKAYVTGTTLTLNFDAATTAIAAGTPYIVKWEGGTEGQYTQDPVFQGVTVSTDTHDYDTQPLTDPGSDTYDATLLTDERVRFIGTYDQKTIATEDRSILFLGTGNNLYYPDGKGSGVTIGAFRAYFKIGDGEALARQLTAFNLSWSADGSSASGIADVSSATPADGDVRAPGWYTLDGVKLDGKPTKKGLYIHKGKKIVVK